MRTPLLLLSIASVLVACADNPDSTAPHAPSTNASATASPKAPPSVMSAAAQGKPSAGTPVTYLTSPETYIDGSTFVSGVALITCPAGSSVVGGGYEFTLGAANANISYNGPVGNNIWRVLVQSASPLPIRFKAMGTCIS